MKKLLLLGIVAGMAVFAVACGNNKTDEQAEVKVPLVAVVDAVIENVAEEQTYSSNVQPWAKNNIAPQNAGRIDDLFVEIGDYVAAGQEVAQMDDVQLQQSNLQLANDELEYSRLRSLMENGGISQSDFDAFEMAYKVHQSQNRNLVKNTHLKSPVAGVISARNYDKGDMYSMAQPLYTVEQIVPVKLLIGISESDYNRVKKGDPAVLTVDAFHDKTFKGTISNIYPTIDSGTHTFSAEVKVANTDRKLRPGMYAKVTVTFGKYDRVVVPDAAVVKQLGSGDRFVYVYDPATETVSYNKVQLGIRQGDKYVILSGVKAGDKVVTEGQLRIRDGVKVRLN